MSDMQQTTLSTFGFRGGRGGGRGRGRGSSSNHPYRGKKQSPAAMKRRDDLRTVAAETKSILPDLQFELEPLDLTASTLHDLSDLPPLQPTNCPGHTTTQSTTPASQPDPDAEARTSPTTRKGTAIRVINADTFDAALSLQPSTTLNTATKPVAVLNLANAEHPGGGWQNGALAQEEALCYRSTLSLTLQPSHYPIPSLGALYSPTVLVFRESMAEGHGLLYPDTSARDLPVTSMISVAGLRKPKVSREGKYEDPADREVMKGKIRTVLRVAAGKGCEKLVLGALGCGVFGNPSEEVARCFVEVFEEEEFVGGWWEEVVFAILDNAREGEGGEEGTGNFGVFWRALDGLVV